MTSVRVALSRGASLTMTVGETLSLQDAEALQGMLDFCGQILAVAYGGRGARGAVPVPDKAAGSAAGAVRSVEQSSQHKNEAGDMEYDGRPILSPHHPFVGDRDGAA